MTARDWFLKAIDEQSVALGAKTIAKRERYALDSFNSFMVAASLGEHEALLNIGVDYQSGAYGAIPARSDLAEHWLRLAASHDPWSILAMGTFLTERGRKAEGRKWLRKALAHGDGGAACHLGREFEEKSPARALRWYLKGVALGDPFAAECAGRMLEAQGSRRALRRAATMYEKMSKQFPEAAQGLARIRRKLSATD